MPTFFDFNSTVRSAGKRGANKALAPPHKITTFLSGLVKPTGQFDYRSKINGPLPMALNDQKGDCTIAGIIHLWQLIYAVLGQQFVYPGDDAVGAVYDHLSPNDQGCALIDVIKFGVTDGLFGEKIVGAGPFDIHNHGVMSTLCYNFGGLYLAGDIPASAEQQFELHQPWHLNKSLPKQPGVGGHCFTGSGANRQGVPTETWGDETEFTWDWWETYGLEGWVIITQTMVDAGHGALANVDIDALKAATQQLVAGA